MSLFVNGKMGWDSMDRPAGDCVKAGVGGSLVDDVGSVETDGELPRDRSWAYDRDFSQCTIIQHNLKLSMHKIERPSITRCWSSGPHGTCSLLLCWRLGCCHVLWAPVQGHYCFCKRMLAD
jgi:hypothetical protein